MTFDLEPAVTLPWLVRLRWAFLAGQLIALPIAYGFGVALDWFALGLEIAIMAASNVALSFARTKRRWLRSEVIGASMALDTALITLLLMGSGGAANPFTVLYLVHITLSAIVLRARWTIAIAALSLAGFGLLFVGSTDHSMMHHGGSSFGMHLQAMWAAFALAAILIAFFVARVTGAISSQRDQIAQLREAGERRERISAVTRLAAGAAHELGSPLATIAVAAHEAKLHFADGARASAIVADLELIALEVGRCQSILGRMAASNSAESDEVLTLGELAERLRDLFGEDRGHRVDFEVASAEVVVTIPRDELVHAVAALVGNALDASDGRVLVTLGGEAGIEIEVRDRGDGIDDDVLARIGTPFFTTKGDGRGLGLGVFLARSFCESRGGRLTIQSTPGVGTRATICLPAEVG